MFHSIRWRIAVPYVILIVLLMVGMSFYISSLVRQTYLSSLEHRLTTQAKLIAEDIAAEFTAGTERLNLDPEAQKFANLLKERVTLIAVDGSVVGESQDDRTRMDNHSNRPEIVQAKESGIGSSTRFSHTEGYEMLYIAVPVKDESGLTGFVRIAISLEEIQSNLGQIQRTAIFSTLTGAVIAILIAFWVASQTTRPLRELTQAADQIASGDHRQRIIPITSDEVGTLTRALNTMSEKLRFEITALESERRKLFAVMNEMSDGVLILNGAGIIQLINPAALTMFGVSASSSEGRSLIEALRQYKLVEIWQKCRESGEPQAMMIEIPSRHLYLQCVATSLGETMPDNTLLLIQNLTRVRHLETVRQEFMSNISHELRTPLASLKALTETLLDGGLDDPQVTRNFLLRIETEVDALSLMVSELLELSRIESGRVPMTMESRSAAELIDRAIERLELQTRRADLQINVEYQPGLPPILADPIRLEQVLVNLLHNAIKFTPAGGAIMIGCRLEGSKMLFFVNDNGIGIPADDLPRIFERFFKIDRARSSHGTGLGLAISKHVVEAHGGTIWVESQEGVGSTFFFTIPLISEL